MDVISISSDSSTPPSPRSDTCSDNLTTLEDIGLTATTKFKGSSPTDSPVLYDTENLSDKDDCSEDSDTYTRNQLCHPIHVISSSDESDAEAVSRNLPKDQSDNEDCELPSVPVLPMTCDGAAIASDSLKKNIDEVDTLPKVATKKRKVTNSNAAAAKAERERKAAERKQKRAEAEQAKALKKAAAVAQRVNRPGECLKYIQVLLDQGLLIGEFGGELLVALQTAELQYAIQEQTVPHTVTWVRTVQEHGVDDNMKVQVLSRLEEEDQVLVIQLWDQVLGLVHTQALRAHMQSIQSLHQGKKVTLVVFGMADYFRFQKTQETREFRAKVRGAADISKAARKEASLRDAPKVSRVQLETALAELQVMEQCCHRLVDSPQELGELVAHFTKAIAERPFKLAKQRAARDKLEWYATGDSRDCVRVDKNGLGLLRLWQQQLCQFHLVGLDVAEAIVSRFSSPQALLQAYDRCTSQKEGEQLLKDIPIRRGVGPLTTVRKVGPELSRKVYVMFNSVDGNTPLSQEKDS